MERDISIMLENYKKIMLFEIVWFLSNTLEPPKILFCFHSTKAVGFRKVAHPEKVGILERFCLKVHFLSF